MIISVSGTYPPCIIGSVADADTFHSLLTAGSTPDCDMLELRVDGLLKSGVNVDEMLQATLSQPLLVTVRTPEEGGLYPFADTQSRADIAMHLIPRASATALQRHFSALCTFAVRVACAFKRRISRIRVTRNTEPLCSTLCRGTH